MLKCNCSNTCPRILVATSVNISDTAMIFGVPNTISPVNNGRYLFKCPVSLLPATAQTTIYQVEVSLNGTIIPLQCKLGNNVYSDQIRCFNTDNCGNIVLRFAYGSTPAHFKIINQDLCCSNAYPVTGTGTTAKKTKATTTENV